MSHAPPRLREYVAASLIVVASRVALQWAGFAFDFSLDWMWLSDPADLRDKLFETLYFYHAFPPGMGLLTGILLKLGGSHAATLAMVTFWTLGLVIVNSLVYLFRVAGVSTWGAVSLAVAFSLLPQSIYFEHLYLYEYPTTSMLCLSAVFFHRAQRYPSFWAWFGVFLPCALIGLTRSSFHLVWFIVLLGLTCWLTERRARRTVLLAACAPAILLLSLYVKNYALFGVFDAFSFGPVSQNLATTWNLPVDVRDAWIAEGRLSPFAAVDVYGGPRDYLTFFDTTENSAWPPEMSLLDRPTVNAPNYNHWFFLEINSRRRADSIAYVRARPLQYATTVLTGLRDIFTPSTEWHPQDKTAASPHARHRLVLGGYETFYNRVVHGFPVAPIGVYVFLPLIVLWTIGRAWSLRKMADPDARARGALLVFCLFQIGYVVAASCIFTFREQARYRYQVEWMIWLITTLCVMSLWRLAEARLKARSHP